MDTHASIVQIAPQGEAILISFTVPCISDTDKISQASQAIREYIMAHKPPLVVMDFAEVKFFSSQVLGLILEIRSHLKSYEGRVAISSIDPQLHRVFRITNLDRILDFYPNSETVLQKM